MKTKHYWQVEGCSWAGNSTKRDGKRVTCGHKHRSRSGASACVAKMRKTKPGNCQDYRAVEIVLVPVSRRARML